MHNRIEHNITSAMELLNIIPAIRFTALVALQRCHGAVDQQQNLSFTPEAMYDFDSIGEVLGLGSPENLLEVDIYHFIFFPRALSFGSVPVCIALKVCVSLFGVPFLEDINETPPFIKP